MNAVSSESIVIASFREFYALLIKLREAVDADPWGASARSVPADVASAREGRVVEIQAELRVLLQQQAASVVRLGGDRAGQRFREAEYVMAALADEVFLSRDWEGRQIWSQNLLESRLFGTHVAGERLFERAEEILREREDREMAMVHLLALSLGFQGQYRGQGDVRVLEDTRARLLAFISRGGSGPLGDGTQLFPQAYGHTLEGDSHTRLPSTARWTVVLAVALVAYLVVGHLLWMDASGALHELVHQIDLMTTAGAGVP